MVGLYLKSWVWIASLAFTLLYGAMFAKSWRLNRIFRESSVKRVVIRDQTLIAVVASLLVVDITLLGVWQAVDPLTGTFLHIKNQMKGQSSLLGKTAEDPPVIHAARVCSCRYFPAWATVMLIYKTAMLVYGAYLSWSIRHVTLPSMNDSPCIVLSCHVTMITACLGIAMATLFRETPDLLYASIASAVWIWTTVTLMLIFIPKVNLWRKKSDEESLKFAIASQVYNSSEQTYEKIEEEMYHLVAENRALKKSLSTKDMTIQSLQLHVVTAQDKLLKLVELDERETNEKRDSGFEVDTSGSSTHENDSGHAGSLTVTSFDVTKINGTLAELNDSFISEVDTDIAEPFRARIMTRQMSRNSVYSCGSERYSEIARELETVGSITHKLRTTIHSELSCCQQRKSHIYDMISSRQDIVGSIADNFQLGDDYDTHSFISSYLRRAATLSLFSYSTQGRSDDNVSQYSTAHSSISRISRHSGYCTSCDSLNAIGNDKFYPSSPKFKRHRRRHGRRRSRRSRWKQEPRDKVYTIQEPREPMKNVTNLAVRREIISTFV
ncbi:uncharacterized protein LOC141907168 [Tubulanus polymorphus]|uniref:uncharacterized protein LOC141907168 n=1 Tax=Tubulanus polymorphus TaxID=672921 RepID=UPI003DA53A28